MKIINPSPDFMPSSDGISIDCYVNEIPAFVQNEMDQLYANIFSSLESLRAEGKIDDARTTTYVVREHGRVRTIFLFRNENGRVNVINEVISIDEREIYRFVKYIFSAFRAVTMIVFRAIQTGNARFGYPCQRLNYLEDIVVSLPATEPEYLSGLGKNTRRNVKRYMSKLRQDIPDVSHDMYLTSEIEEQYVRDIVELNRVRMENKTKRSAIDENEAELLISQARKNGLICVIKNSGVVIAGAISFQVGKNYFLSVLAHDPQYDEYSLGTLCCFLIINECISRNGKEFHFLWGRYPYKYTLMGTQRDLDYLAIYRSQLSVLRNVDATLFALFRAYVRRTFLWLNEAKKNKKIVGVAAARLLGFVRYMRLKVGLV